MSSPSPSANPSPPDAPSSVATASPLARLKRLLRPLMLLVALAFVGLAVREIALRWSSQPLVINPWLALASLVPLVLGTCSQALAWTLLIERLAGVPVPRAEAMALHLESQLGRYTPGKLALPAIRIAGASRIGVAPRLVGVSVLLEVLPWAVTGVGAGALLLAGFGGRATLELTRGMPWLATLVAGSCAAFVGALAILSPQQLPLRLRAVLGLECATGAILPLPALLGLFGCHAGWFGHGLLLALAFGATPTTVLEAASVVVLAPPLSFLVLVAPAGAGVREALFVLGLTPLVGAPTALGVALASRGASVVADVSAWALAAAAARLARGSARGAR